MCSSDLSGQDGRPTGATDGIGDKAAIEAGPLSGQPINIWCFQQMSIFPIGTDRLAREVVAEDKDNIRTSIGSSVLGCLSWTVLRSGDAGQKASQQQTATEHMGTF